MFIVVEEADGEIYLPSRLKVIRLKSPEPDTSEFCSFPVKMAAVVISKFGWIEFLAFCIGGQRCSGPEYGKISFRADSYNAVKIAVDSLGG